MDSKHPLIYFPGPFNGGVTAMFFAMGYRGTRDLTIADMVVFTGGSDIDPAIYHEKPIVECGQPDKRRDAQEIAAFEAAKNWGVPMVGICRGAQLLNALNGGTLFQHVDGHIGPHYAQDLRTKKIYQVTSTHHQMMRPAQDAKLIAVATPMKDKLLQAGGSLSTMKKFDGGIITPKVKDFDPEVIWYPATKSLCFQPHPEYGGAGGVDTRGYFVELLAEFIEDDFDSTEVKETA